MFQVSISGPSFWILIQFLSITLCSLVDPNHVNPDLSVTFDFALILNNLIFNFFCSLTRLFPYINKWVPDLLQIFKHQLLQFCHDIFDFQSNTKSDLATFRRFLQPSFNELVKQSRQIDRISNNSANSFCKKLDSRSELIQFSFITLV